MKLTDAAARLLQVLVDQIRTGRVDPRNPKTSFWYGEALNLVQLAATAPPAAQMD